ncbi:hypothetical protein HK096_009329, partial [Nowakowskiella sp. JEL0078]
MSNAEETYDFAMNNRQESLVDDRFLGNFKLGVFLQTLSQRRGRHESVCGARTIPACAASLSLAALYLVAIPKSAAPAEYSLDKASVKRQSTFTTLLAMLRGLVGRLHALTLICLTHLLAGRDRVLQREQGALQRKSLLCMFAPALSLTQFLSQSGIFGDWILSLMDPADVRVFYFKTNELPKILPKDVVPGTVVDDNGSVWKQHRKITNPAFHRSWSTSLIGESALTLIDEWDKLIDTQQLNSAVVHVSEWMARFTLDTLGNAIFTTDFNSIRVPDNKLVTLYKSAFAATANIPLIMFPWLINTPLPSMRKIKKDVNDFKSMIADITTERLKQIESGALLSKKEPDLLDMMLQSLKDESNDGLSIDDINRNVIVFFTAGHDTTASSLTAILYLLAKHGEIQEKVRQEVFKILGESSVNVIPTIEQQKEM